MTFGPRRLVALLVVVCAFYLVLVADRGLVLVTDGRLPFVLLGVGVLLLPVVGVAIVWQEVRFGRNAERLTHTLEDERNGPEGLPRADELDDVGQVDAPGEVGHDFARSRREVEASPGDWRAWVRLAYAYADAKDVPAARRAMRTAIDLESRR